jgi:hypothetical protein
VRLACLARYCARENERVGWIGGPNLTRAGAPSAQACALTGVLLLTSITVLPAFADRPGAQVFAERHTGLRDGVSILITPLRPRALATAGRR